MFRKPWNNKIKKSPRKFFPRGGSKGFKGFKTSITNKNFLRNNKKRNLPPAHFKKGYFKPFQFKRNRSPRPFRQFRFKRNFQNKRVGKFRRGKARRYGGFKGKRHFGNNNYMRFYNNEINFNKFAKLLYFFFKKDVSPSKKVIFKNYWEPLKKFVKHDFSFTFPMRDAVFYKGVIRSYIRAIAIFIRSFLNQLVLSGNFKNFKKTSVLRAYYRSYKIFTEIQYLSKLYGRGLERPIFYFKGYQTFLRSTFFKVLVMFTMKIFISANRIFSNSILRINNHNNFFVLWKKIYKNWLNIFYQKPSRFRLTPQVDRRAFLARRVWLTSLKNRDLKAEELYSFRRERSGFKRILKKYFFGFARTNYKTRYPFSYRRKKYRFRHSILGRKIYIQKKRLFRRKSRKYIRWFRTLVTGAYYTSKIHAEKTFFRAGFGRRAWISRRRAKHVFKMKFVFIRYFSKRFGLKNRTAFLRKAEHIARKRGDKWLRYYREFESRLERVLVLFNFCGNDRMAKGLINNNWVVVNRRVLNDHDYKIKPRVKMGDLVSLANAALPSVLKKKFKFFRKRLHFFDRGEEAKLLYKLFKKYFLEWIAPSVYSITGPIVKHGFSALMSGPTVRNSRIYFSINRRIPFFNRGLFKLFVQRFSKKLN